MLMEIVDGRIMLPAEDETKPMERTVFHPETNVDKVIMSADGTTLREFLGQQTNVSPDKPEPKTDAPIFWRQVMDTELEDDDL